MVIFLYGKDTFRLVRHRAYLKEEFRRKHPDGGMRVADCEETDVDATRAAREFLAPSLFEAPRFLSIEHAEKVASDRNLPDALDGVPGDRDRVVVISYFGAPKASEPLPSFLLKSADCSLAFEPMTTADAAAFVRDEARAVSATTTFSRDAADQLVRIAEGDSAWLSTEARKLAAYRPDGEVSGGDVAALSVEDHRESVFIALDELVAGARARALARLLDEARSAGTTAPILGMIAWQLREFFRVRGEYDRGRRSEGDIARSIGAKPFVVRKALSRLRDFPERRLDAAVAHLARFDRSIKTGRMDGETALALFVEKF